MLLTLVAALAEDRIIGSASGGIPWDHPRDRAHFRARTAGRWLLAGRRTYLEMEGWFDDRIPIVLTQQPGFRPFHPAHRIATSPAAAVELARTNGASELLVCGGAAVYGATLPFADRLVLTRIALRADVADPVSFPDFETSGEWLLRHAESWPAEGDAPAARCEVHERTRKGPLVRGLLSG